MIAESIFLLPNGTFIVELVVVAVILYLVTKYILPPLNKAIESRQEKIRSSLELADQARAPKSWHRLVTRHARLLRRHRQLRTK
jgi:hypothetical protein